MGIIRVNQIKVYAYHGCLDEEGTIGCDYEVDVELHTDFQEAAENDDLTKTIDYVVVNRVVKEEMKIRAKLIEHVGLRIVRKLKSTLDTAEKVIVTVRKINPPINGHVHHVSVTLEG